MKTFNFTNLLVLISFSFVLIGCTIQQPLPNSLYGEWTFIKTGIRIDSGNERLHDYINPCYKENDRIHFSSDKKMTLRWYDPNCGFHYNAIGRYSIVGNSIMLELSNEDPYQNNPFPPVTEFRIIYINDTTLKLEEIPNENNTSGEAVVFVFLKYDN